jgi:quinoprotein glucose dehydrogenase
MASKHIKRAFLAVALIIGGAANAQDTAATWSSYGGAPGGGQYSSLSQITRENVADLKLVWTHRNGDAAKFKAGGKTANYEVTPILAEGALFICTQYGRIISLDPKSGRENWAFDPFAALVTEAPSPGTCRGVTYWAPTTPAPDGTACATRIFLAQYGSRLISVDAKTGQPCADFGAGGVLDMTSPDNGGTGRMRFTSPPAVLGDTVIIAGSIGDNIRANQPDGVIRAFDARSGKLLWRVVTIPPEMSEATGNADVWPPYSVDAKRNMVFIPTGSPSPDFYGGQRQGFIPYANALLAMDATTGEVKWHFQTVRHDVFDYDVPSQPILADITKGGEKIPAVIQITKMGVTFVLNRDTGAPVFPIEDMPVPQSDVPGEKTSPTQPRPTLPKPFSSQLIKPEEVFGLTPLDRKWCRDSLASMRYEGPYTPPSFKTSLLFPAATGGGNWGGAAYDPERNLLIVKAQNLGFTVQLLPVGDPNIPDVPETAASRVMDGTPYYIYGERWLSPLGVPCNPPPWGELVAINMDSGAEVWRRPVGQVPFGPGKFLRSPAAWGSPIVGGPMVTGGGVVFMAATFDPVFRAYDVETGQELWSAPTPVPAMAVPMTYEWEGRQYVLIAAGGSILAGTDLSDEILAFALPER